MATAASEILESTERLQYARRKSYGGLSVIASYDILAAFQGSRGNGKVGDKILGTTFRTHSRPFALTFYLVTDYLVRALIGPYFTRSYSKSSINPYSITISNSFISMRARSSATDYAMASKSANLDVISCRCL